MAVSYTTTYNLTKPEVGASEDQWGDLLNTNFDSIDDILDGTTPITGIDINSGTLDGVTIGGTTAGAGTFTTLTANTSLDVAGTITSDGLTVDGGGSVASFGNTANNNSIVVNRTTTNPSSFRMVASSAAPAVEWTGTSTFKFYDVNSGYKTRLGIGPTGDISFYEDTGTTAKFFWDASADRLGIGTTSPSEGIHLKAASGNSYIKAERTTASQGEVGFNTNDWYMYQKTNSTDLNFYNTADRMTIDGSGNVGIGLSNPSAYGKLAVEGTATQLAINASSGKGRIGFFEGGTGRFYIDTLNGSDGLAFVDADGSSERMRIDSSGNLLVGTTSTATNDVGFKVFQSTGQTVTTASGTNPVLFNRKTSDGDIAVFRKDDTTVGSIGANSGNIYIGSGDTGIAFSAADDTVYPITTATGGIRDAAIDLGGSTYRYKDIYATNGTIQTSDRNEKQDIAELSDAEQRVAVAAKGLLRKFRWKDAVAEKGDEARTHFGIIAQDLQAAFAAEGLDAGNYGMFIHTTWTDEETGEEKSRMGVRYSELLAFIIAAI